MTATVTSAHRFNFRGVFIRRAVRSSAVRLAALALAASGPLLQPRPGRAAEAVEAPPPAPRPETVAASASGVPLPDWLRSLSIGGGVILWYYRPVELGAGTESNVDLFFANLLLDGKFGRFSLHVEPRFRDSRLREFFPGPVWAQEAYASVAFAPSIVLKAGKVYSHFGLFWDNSFYGNVQVYDGLKLDPDYGLSFEGAIRPDEHAGLRFWAQYFVVDGHTNVSLVGRDTISRPGGHRRNQTIVRAEPFVRTDSGVTVTGGVSGVFLQADLGSAGTNDIYRAAGDISVSWRRFSGWAEYTRQQGRSVTGFPVAATPATPDVPAVPGQSSAHINYALGGARVALGQVTVRYNASTGRYEDQNVSEWMHVPALAYAVGSNLAVLGEYVDWRRYAAGGHTLVDRSVDVTLSGHF